MMTGLTSAEISYLTKCNEYAKYEISTLQEGIHLATSSTITVLFDVKELTVVWF